MRRGQGRVLYFANPTLAGAMPKNEDTDVIRLLAERILTMRKEEDYYQVSVETAEGMADVAPPQLIGNLGGISFHTDGVSYGEGLLAASASIKYHLEDYLMAQGIQLVMINATKDGELFVTPEGQPTEIHRPRYEVKKGRTHDSEYILLHALDAFLQGSGKSKGKLYLLTERIPCASCTRVIRWFCGQYKDIQVAVYYLHNTARKTKVDGQPETILRNADDFYRECALPQVELSWVALNADTVDTGKHLRGLPVASTDWIKADMYPPG
jgi:hypothetical protein